MMQATFTIPIAEFDHDLIDKIKSLFIGKSQDAEVIISIRANRSMLKKETREEYFARLDEAIDNLDNRRNLVSFTLEEFEQAFPDAEISSAAEAVHIN